MPTRSSNLQTLHDGALPTFRWYLGDGLAACRDVRVVVRARQRQLPQRLRQGVGLRRVLCVRSVCARHHPCVPVAPVFVVLNRHGHRQVLYINRCIQHTLRGARDSLQNVLSCYSKGRRTSPCKAVRTGAAALMLQHAAQLGVPPQQPVHQRQAAHGLAAVGDQRRLHEPLGERRESAGVHRPVRPASTRL